MFSWCIWLSEGIYVTRDLVVFLDRFPRFTTRGPSEIRVFLMDGEWASIGLIHQHCHMINLAPTYFVVASVLLPSAEMNDIFRYCLDFLAANFRSVQTFSMHVVQPCTRRLFLLRSLLVCCLHYHCPLWSAECSWRTVNPLYTDTRYNDKIHYNDNLNVTKHSLKRWQLMRNYARMVALKLQATNVLNIC